MWSPLPCAAFPAGELLQSSPGCFWGISLTRAARGSAGALEPVQLSRGLAGGDYLRDNSGRSNSVCGELSEGAEGKGPAVCMGLLQWVWAVLPVSLCPLPVLVPLPIPPCWSQGDRRASGGAQRCVDAGLRTSASSLWGLTGPRALRGTGGSSTTVFKEKEEKREKFFPSFLSSCPRFLPHLSAVRRAPGALSLLRGGSRVGVGLRPVWELFLSSCFSSRKNNNNNKIFDGTKGTREAQLPPRPDPRLMVLPEPWP